MARFGRPPARLTNVQVAWVLNCQPHDVPVLVSAGLLKPLGRPMPNSVKYFATTAIMEIASDRAWLAKMTEALYCHWRSKNAKIRGSAKLDLEPDPGET